MFISEWSLSLSLLFMDLEFEVFNEVDKNAEKIVNTDVNLVKGGQLATPSQTYWRSCPSAVVNTRKKKDPASTSGPSTTCWGSCPHSSPSLSFQNHQSMS